MSRIGLMPVQIPDGVTVDLIEKVIEKVIYGSVAWDSPPFSF